MKNRCMLLVLSLLFQGLNIALFSQTLVIVPVSQPPVLQADAGGDATLSNGQKLIIGGSPSATGGTSNYTYSWMPTTGLDSPTLANPRLTISATQTFTLIVTDARNCTASDDVEITLVMTSLNDLDLKKAMLYPNPTTGISILELPASESDYSLSLFSTEGDTLWEKQVKANRNNVKQEIDLDSFALGIYILIIKSGGKTWTSKIIKQ